MSYSMGAYPPGTHAGDPRAPWNEEDAPTCASCRMWRPYPDEEHGLCLSFAGANLRRLREAATDDELLEAVAAITWDYTTDDCHTCDDWEEER